MPHLADLLAAERARRGTRGRTRSLTTREQAVLVLRWFLEGTRMSQLARDNRISKSTGYDYLHEGADALAAHPICTQRRWRPRPPGTATSTSTAR